MQNISSILLILALVSGFTSYGANLKNTKDKSAADDIKRNDSALQTEQEWVLEKLKDYKNNHQDEYQQIIKGPVLNINDHLIKRKLGQFYHGFSDKYTFFDHTKYPALMEYLQ